MFSFLLLGPVRSDCGSYAGKIFKCHDLACLVILGILMLTSTLHLGIFPSPFFQVPESIAFSFVAGVPPLSGLHATFWMACITGLLGGKPAMISGAAGALAVVVTDLTADDGVLGHLTAAERLNVLYMTMFVCGIAQIVFAWLRLGQIVKLIPQTGLIGFMDGLAISTFAVKDS